MLGTLFSLFQVQLLIDHGLNQTVCVRYFTESTLGLFGNFPMIKAVSQC